ncbi:AAA family ATPase [Tenacibaculum maritimum]|nr:AAA family ATPase [Tenacibaculum maritimum]
METIRIKKLNLLNFKGTRNLEINFNQVTNIYGDNATGKTTVFDAFLWLLFGKDSLDRKNFEIKTLDSQNQVIPKIEHEVTALLEVNGEDIEIKRILKEKWVKKRGALEADFNGNETLYYWNDVPLQAKEFQTKINGLVDEGIFKLITNPLYFNGLKWQDRRNVLISIAGEVTDYEVAEGNEQFLKLITGLKTKTIQEYKREISARKKKLNDDLKAIPTRIDEANRSMPEAIDFEAVKKEITTLETELKTVEDSLLDSSKALQEAQKKRTNIQQEVFDCKTKLQNIEFEEKQKLNNSENENKATFNNLKRDLQSKESELSSIDRELTRLKSNKENLDKKRITLRDDWGKINADEIKFNDNDFSCPTCKRGFEASDVDEKKKTLTDNFQADKTKRLNDIQTEGKQIAKQVEDIEASISTKETEKTAIVNSITEIKNSITKEEDKLATPKGEVSLNFILTKIPEYNDLIFKIKSLEGQTIEAPQVDTSELQKRKSEINSKINELRNSLNSESVIERGKKRISELEAEEKNLAQQISELEGSEFTIDAFIKAKIETLESRINGKFSIVKFKLFETQINGGEVECCEALINGVPFSDLNNAARINAGLDIINALCEFHKVSAPVFIDNRESVNSLIDLNSQLVNLIVSNDPKLKIA